MIELKELTKRYEDGVLALDGATYTVEQGEVFCLLGANGAGKTTTVNILLDFIRPTSGAASINGYDCNKEPLIAKKYVSYVSENVQLYGMFTARQNLSFFAEVAGRKGLKKKDFEDVMAAVGLPQSALRMRLRHYSKGMRQKLGIAIALLRNAPAVIMDEPTSGLDPESAREFLELLRRLREQGKAILMTTHDIFRAKMIADRVGIMKQGRVAAIHQREDFAHQDLEEMYLHQMQEAGAAEK